MTTTPTLGFRLDVHVVAEYYPTRSERAILAASAPDIARRSEADSDANYGMSMSVLRGGDDRDPSTRGDVDADK